MIFAGIEWTVTRTRGMRGYREGSMGGVPDDPDTVEVEAVGVASITDLIDCVYDTKTPGYITSSFEAWLLKPEGNILDWAQRELAELAVEEAQEGGYDE